MNPAEGFKALNPIKDFPRHRRLEDCKDETPVVASTWKLDQDERDELVAILPSAKNVERVTVERRFSRNSWDYDCQQVNLTHTRLIGYCWSVIGLGGSAMVARAPVAVNAIEGASVEAA